MIEEKLQHIIEQYTELDQAEQMVETVDVLKEFKSLQIINE